VLLLFQHWHPPHWPVHTSFPPYEQLLVVEVSGAVPVPIPVPIPIIVVIVVPLTVPLAPFSTGSSSFLAWCSPTSLLAANTRDPPCKQLLTDMGVGAGLSVIIGVCCGRSSLVAVGPRSEGLGGGTVTWHGWKGQVVLTAAVEWGLFVRGCLFTLDHSCSFMVIRSSLTVPVCSWSFVCPRQHLLTHPASSCSQQWW
jgi:hypothetical protein